jgi:hypothetical protein
MSSRQGRFQGFDPAHSQCTSVTGYQDSSSPIGCRMSVASTGVSQIRWAGSLRMINCCCSWSIGKHRRCAANRYQRLTNCYFLGGPAITAGLGAVRGQTKSPRNKEKVRCHAGGALWQRTSSLCPNPCLHHPPGALRQTQKVQRMTRSQSERLTRWEGAVNGRSDVCGPAEELRRRLPSADKLPSTPIASPGRRLLSQIYSTDFLFAAAGH